MQEKLEKIFFFEEKSSDKFFFTCEEKFKKICCYNCLDLNHAQSFLQCLLIVFSVLWSRKKCLKKVTNSQPSASNLHNLFSTQFSSRVGKTSNSHWEKLFSRQSNVLNFYPPKSCFRILILYF
jgi:hypothetical protein